LPTVEQAAEQTVEEIRAAIQRRPYSLQLVNALMSALLVAGRPMEAIAVADDALRRFAASPAGYEDDDIAQNWTYDLRGEALEHRRLGRGRRGPTLQLVLGGTRQAELQQ
jgi:hypothetical protein